MRFEMTLGTLVKVTTALTAVVVPVQLAVLWTLPVAPVRPVAGGVMAVVALVLVLTALWAPRAVRLDAARLVVERRGWFDFELPLRQVTRVERGPALELLGGDVRRVAGNGGLMGFTGLYRVAGVGLVRCFATRLGRPTVLVHRAHERPLLLGVDDADGLLTALRRRAG